MPAATCSDPHGAASTIARRYDLDALRAVAMLSGIALHAAMAYMPAPWPVQDEPQYEEWGLLVFGLHGFRMPLFFLISGFFTAMLWRKRGLGSLLWHRFRRVFIPLVLGCLTIVPAINWISVRAMEAGLPRATAALADLDSDDDLWTAVRLGDLDAVEEHLEDGDDINALHPRRGQTPLTLAAFIGRRDVVEALIDHGADVDGRTWNGSTALHNAAFFGHAEVAEALLEHGTDPQALNREGHTAVEVMVADWYTTLLGATFEDMELRWHEVVAGRAAVAALLGGAEAPAIQRDIRRPAAATGLDGILHKLRSYVFFHHLWFLWFLCWLVAGFAVYAAIADRLGWKGLPARLVLSPARLLWLIPLSLVPQWFMGRVLAVFGPDISVSLLPMPHVLAYYAIFFGFGALYYDADDSSGRLGRWWWLTLPVGLFAILPLGLDFVYGSFGLREHVDTGLHRPIANLLQVLYAWLMTFGCIGLFRALLSRTSATARYLSDSSYWMYVVHLPLVIVAQLAMLSWDVSPALKFVVTCASVSVVVLLTYHLFVRYTFIGTLLNGPRTRKR